MEMVAVRSQYYVGHRNRLRERFMKAGAEGFHDYELIELLLTYAVPRRDVKPLAKELMNRFGSLAGIIDASQKELEEAKNIGPASAVLVRLVKEICSEYMAERIQERDLVSSPGAVVDFARMRLAGLPNETFAVLFLNVKNEVMNYEIIHEGTIDRAVVYPRRIIEYALGHHAAGLILIHNHPSGHPEPSSEDRDITQAIIHAARTVDIRVLDHIVIGGDGYFSFAEEGEMQF